MDIKRHALKNVANLSSKVKNMGEIIIQKGTQRLKEGFAKMQKGGVIMDVVNPDQARLAQDAGAVAVMALHAVPADIRAAGGVARMADPQMVKEIVDSVTIPVMAKCRIGHFAEAQILQQVGVDMIDESEVLTPADEDNHIDKVGFSVPFVCGARNLGEALRRIHEGAAMIRTKGEPGTGNVVEAVRHMNRMNTEISEIVEMKEDPENLTRRAEEYLVPLDLVKKTAELGRLPVVNFAAGGIATVADSALMMQMGCDGIFVGSGIFKSKDPDKFAKAIVEATKHYDEPATLLEISKGLGEPMKGIEISEVPKEQRMQDRGI
jgi:pyridoxal 5'-phosphate synthase pdxS subunit